VADGREIARDARSLLVEGGEHALVRLVELLIDIERVHSIEVGGGNALAKATSESPGGGDFALVGFNHELAKSSELDR